MGLVVACNEERLAGGKKMPKPWLKLKGHSAATATVRPKQARLRVEWRILLRRGEGSLRLRYRLRYSDQFPCTDPASGSGPTSKWRDKRHLRAAFGSGFAFSEPEAGDSEPHEIASGLISASTSLRMSANWQLRAILFFTGWKAVPCAGRCWELIVSDRVRQPRLPRKAALLQTNLYPSCTHTGFAGDCGRE